MTSQSYHPVRTFTVEEANARLPLVRAIVGDIVRLSRELRDRRERLHALRAGRSRNSTDVYLDELQHVEDQLEKESERLREYLDELIALGVEPKSAIEGLVDFPAVLEGKLVFLCWKYDEPEIMYWHDLDAGFAGRQSLAVSADAGGAGEMLN